MKASARLLSRSAAHSPARLRYRAVPSQRGFSEQAGEHLPGMALDDPLELLTGALQAQWKRYRKKLKRCQQKFSEKAVHDSRVETRRLLATMDLLGELIARARIKKARRALKEHLDTFDALRDTQVQLLYVAKMVRIFPPARPFHAHLLKCERQSARETRKRIKRIKAKRLGKRIAVCIDELRQRRKDVGARHTWAALLRILERAFQRVLHLLKRVDARDAGTIHRTRIAFKRFRYMIELLTRILPGLRAPRRAVLRQYQGMMGDIQDMRVLLGALEKFLHKHKLGSHSADMLLDELQRRRQWLIQRFLEKAAQARTFKPSLLAAD